MLAMRAGKDTLMHDERTGAYLRVLDPADNSTGGGSASAIAGGMAAALVAMVARLSTGRDSSEPEAYYLEVAELGSRLSEMLIAGAEEDARSFDAVMAAYRLPKATAAEQDARRAAVQAAMVRATRVPLLNAEACAEVMALVARLQGRSNPRAASDLQCAGYLARAGLQGCLANIAINLPGIKDPIEAEEIWARAARLQETLQGSDNPAGLS
jgi:formiminotetrahydrofolate cyclodeaminase